jgi:hypothetical protein
MADYVLVAARRIFQSITTKILQLLSATAAKLYSNWKFEFSIN